MEYDISKGFLYTLWNNQLRVKEGVVIGHRGWNKLEAIFKYGDRDSDWTRCSPEPGKLVHASLWLPERDDTKAKKILVDYYIGNIERLENQIAGYKEKIRLLNDA